MVGYAYDKFSEIHMQYSNLKYFKKAAEEENFTRAARALGVSQAYLSRVIRSLEDDIGVPLFYRFGKRVELSEYGKLLLKGTETYFHIIHSAKNELLDAVSSDKQKVRLIARSPMGDFPSVLKGFYDENPQVTVPVLTPGDDRVESNYDLEYFASSEDYQGKNIRKLCDEEYVLLVSSNHQLANRSQIALHDLKDVSFVTSPKDTQMSRVQKALYEQAGYRPNVKTYSSSYWALLNLVEQNVGVCIGCSRSWLVKVNLRIKAIPFSDVRFTRHLYLKWPSNAYLTEATISLMNYLERLFDSFEISEKMERL